MYLLDITKTEKKVMDRLNVFVWDNLPKDSEHSDRRATPWGTKTRLGFARCIIRIVKEAEQELEG